MISPYVRRRRLAAELRKIREERDLTTDEVAKRVYQSRSKISKLENAQLRPDLHEILKILEALDVTGKRYDKIFQLARDAAEKGWWDAYGQVMGPRQRLYADLEAGASRIRSYNQTAVPTILQIPEFTEALVELDQLQGPIDYRPQRMLDARTKRQARLLSPDGPTYDAVMEESVFHRLAIPRPTMAAQLRHMADTVEAEQRITIQVLLPDVLIPGGFLPQASFSVYTFLDRQDPAMAVVDTVNTDLVHTQRREVARYTGMYDRLRKAALRPADSVALLRSLADRMTDDTGPGT